MDEVIGTIMIGGNREENPAKFDIRQYLLIDDQSDLEWTHKLDIAIFSFIRHGCTKVIIDSDGDTMDDVEKVLRVINRISEANMVSELRTNGVLISNSSDYMWRLYGAGLNILNVDRITMNYYDDYNGGLSSLEYIIRGCNKYGIMVNLSITTHKECVSTYSDVINSCKLAKKLGANKIIIKQMEYPYKWQMKLAGPENTQKVRKYIKANKLSDDDWDKISNLLVLRHTYILESTLSDTYMVNGIQLEVMNSWCQLGTLCDIVELIYETDGHMRYSQKYRNAIIF